MRKTLIEKVLDDIELKDKDISKIKFILPSRRSIRFFEKELKKKYDKGIYILDLVTIEDLMSEISGLDKIDNISLLFEFYNVYKFLEKEKAEDFSNFIKWANVFLSDINEINLHTENSQEILDYLIDIDRIEAWNPSNMDSNLINNYVGYWRRANFYFLELNKSLKEKNIGYQGLIFREAIQKIDKINMEKDIYFVGFNALTYCEEYLIKNCLKLGNTSIFWDTDKFYLDNEVHEAGLFIRRYQKWGYYNTNDFLYKEDYLKEKKNLNIYGVTGNTNQALVINYILENKIENKEDLSNTLVALADENILLPLINNLPSSVDNFNITMEFPLKNLAISQFFRDIINMYLNKTRLGIGKGYFYYKDAISILRNSFLTSFLNLEEVILKINNINNNVISKRFILDCFAENNKDISFIEYIFIDEEYKAIDFIKFMNKILLLIKENNNEKFSDLEKEYIYHYFNIFSILENRIENYNIELELEFLNVLYNQILTQETIPFVGEPLLGLQIMGMLETRLLDFKNVIISSVNEGVLPEGKSDNSYIPYDVKKIFKIPTYDDKDAIFSYHFYRLLQRSENIYLIYNSKEDYLGAGEESRFIKQIEFELGDKYNIVREYPFSEIVKKIEIRELKIEKNIEIKEKLKEKFLNKISPSSINLYLKDQIGFYKKYVLGIKELEEKEDSISRLLMGNIIHDTLFNLYNDFIGKNLEKIDIKNFREKYQKILINKIKEEYKIGNYTSGKNILVRETIDYYLNSFFDREEKIARENKLRIIGLEKEYNREIDIFGKFNVNLLGKIDRIDQLNEEYRVIDYKTGKIDLIELKKGNLTLDLLKKKPQILQLLFYKLLLKENIKESEMYLYSFKENVYKRLSIKEDNVLEVFEDILKGIIKEIMEGEVFLI